MNHEQVLVTLYDLMLTLSGEVKLEPLTANFLRRLLYHTGFACGIMVRVEGAADDRGRVPVKICQALGNRELVQRVGQSLTLPAVRVLGDSTCIDRLDAPIGLFLDSQRYPCMLRLRIGSLGAVLLFAPAKPEHGDDLALIFAPVLDRFERAYRNCQAAEAYALQLEQEAEQRRKAQQALSESERQLWMMVEFAPTAIAIFGRDERTQYLNSKFIELFGFTPHDIPSLADWGRLAFADPERHAETRKQWDAALRRGDDTGREVSTIRTGLASKTGDIRSVEVRTKRFDGRIMMVLIDLEMEERLKRLPSSSNGGAGQRAEIIAGISQDLYTPLNAILGFAQLLEMDAAGLEASIRDNVEQIAVAGRQLQAIIDRAVKSSLAELDSPAEPEPAKPLSRILVAEDYLPNQQLLARQLKRIGLEADFAENGAKALALWQQHDYALLLTDCNMPVMDGFELTAQIRAAETGRSRRTPIIAITANTVGEEAERCGIVGMDDFLAKPVQLQELEQTLKRWLKHAPAALPVGIRPAGPAPIEAAPSVPAEALGQVRPGAQTAPGEPPAPGRDISLNRLAALLGEDDPREILRLLEIFSRSVEELMEEARAAGRAADMRTLAQAMHKLKSSARTIGAVDLAELAQNTELAAKASDWPQVEQLLPGLDAGVGQVVAQIRALLVAPLLEGVSQIEVPGPVAASQAESASSDLARMDVLLVDDDAFIREQIAGMLRRLGIVNLRLAGEGSQALTLLDDQPGKVDLIITDLNMPGMDGVEFIRHLYTRKFAGNLIFISGEDSRVLSTVRELAEAQGLHVLGTLTKPVVPATLFALMRRQGQARSKAVGGSAGPQVSLADVQRGIAQGEFTVFFQPKVDSASLEVIGVEALARWIRPGKGMVSPGVFIPLAEGNGLIEPLTMALLTRAIALCGELHRAGYPIKMAVNYSALAFGNLQVPEFIVEQTAKAGLEPKHLIMEVTESGLMGDITVALDVLTRLRLKGVNLSIDDFGTGYSSMDQLRRIPFSELKIDQSFVRGAATDRLSRSILESSVDMAKKLNLVTVAEGVETEEDLELVRSLGCDMIQGFYIAKPMALQDLLVWLAQRPAPAA